MSSSGSRATSQISRRHGPDSSSNPQEDVHGENFVEVFLKGRMTEAQIYERFGHVPQFCEFILRVADVFPGQSERDEKITPPQSPTESESGPQFRDLCRDCADLELELAVARAHHFYESARRGNNNRTPVASRAGRDGPIYLRDFYYVSALGNRILDPASTCSLCTFFGQHADPEDERPAGSKSYKLVAICSSETCLFEYPKRDMRDRIINRPGWDKLEYNVFLAVVPDLPGIPRTGLPLRWLEESLPRVGAIYRLTKGYDDPQDRQIISPRDIGAKASLSRAKRWLEVLCPTFHGPCCAPKKPAGETLRWFKVIDCTSATLEIREVSWGETPYVALSYVWGPSTEKWPPTIKDAAEVTRELGQRYLWVDRLCIDQDNVTEKMYLVQRMDRIYAGAELTIINAAGDAETGLPGVGTTPRNTQPRITFSNEARTDASDVLQFTCDDDMYLYGLGVPEAEYDRETEGHMMWEDQHREGMTTTMTVDVDEVLQHGEFTKRAAEYGISTDHLEFFEQWAEDEGVPLADIMERHQELARRMGIPISELIPQILSQAGGRPQDMPANPKKFLTNPQKPIKRLPPGRLRGQTTLVSTMQDPRITIRRSKWGTRGWTYQEGVLPARRLVFTSDQIYWECNNMTLQETTSLPVSRFHIPLPQSTPEAPIGIFGDYLLSGLFTGDLHRTPELQYGYRTSERIGNSIRDNNDDDDTETDKSHRFKSLTGHIKTFTARNLTNASDSLNAFLGIASAYSSFVLSATNSNPTCGKLAHIVGIPIWSGTFADGSSGLQHSFAFSVSTWVHSVSPSHSAKARENEDDTESDEFDDYWSNSPEDNDDDEAPSALHATSALRRPQLPSWSWSGWEGIVDFDPSQSDAHKLFFRAKLNPDWVKSVEHTWSPPDMCLHTQDKRYWTLLAGNLDVDPFANPPGLLLLTIPDPWVLQHFHLIPSSNFWEWRRLMGKLVESIYLSVKMTEKELKEGHKTGELVSVLVYAGTAAFKYTGEARFLILRRAAGTAGSVTGAGPSFAAKQQNWERIGIFVLSVEESIMGRYKNPEDMVKDLPVKKFGSNITIV
ncbi:Heterokaryon incompatibility protein (HET) domain containing protein [Naviculisporaceae sp. PSN 640]